MNNTSEEEVRSSLLVELEEAERFHRDIREWLKGTIARPSIRGRSLEWYFAQLVLLTAMKAK